MNDIWDAPNDYRNYLIHFGIKGMHWGVRRYQNPDGSLTDEGYLRYASNNLKKAKGRNLNKWGKDANHNILYITGQSGSGKSTIAKAVDNGKANKIHLDNYIDTRKDPQFKDKEFNKFLEKNGKKPTFVRDAKDNSVKEFGKALEEFEELIEDFGKEQYDKNKKVVVEGVQLLDDTIRPDKTFFKDKPIIVNKTSALKSEIRALSRDMNTDEVYNVSTKVHYFLERSDYIKMTMKKRIETEAVVNDLIKQLDMSDASIFSEDILKRR